MLRKGRLLRDYRLLVEHYCFYIQRFYSFIVSKKKTCQLVLDIVSKVSIYRDIELFDNIDKILMKNKFVRNVCFVTIVSSSNTNKNLKMTYFTPLSSPKKNKKRFWLVLDIVSKISIDIFLKYRTFRCIVFVSNVFRTFVPWQHRVFYADTEPEIPHLEQMIDIE